MSEYQSVPQTTSGGGETNTMALISLIFGILGLTACPGLGSIIAVITGYMGRNEIRNNPGRYSSEGLATAGIILGWVGVALMCLGVMVWVLIVGLGMLSSLALAPVVGF